MTRPPLAYHHFVNYIRSWLPEALDSTSLFVSVTLCGRTLPAELPWSTNNLVTTHTDSTCNTFFICFSLTLSRKTSLQNKSFFHCKVTKRMCDSFQVFGISSDIQGFLSVLWKVILTKTNVPETWAPSLLAGCCWASGHNNFKRLRSDARPVRSQSNASSRQSLEWCPAWSARCVELSASGHFKQWQLYCHL